MHQLLGPVEWKSMDQEPRNLHGVPKAGQGIIKLKWSERRRWMCSGWNASRKEMYRSIWNANVRRKDLVVPAFVHVINVNYRNAKYSDVCSYMNNRIAKVLMLILKMFFVSEGWRKIFNNIFAYFKRRTY